MVTAENRGRWLILLATVLWSLSGFFTKSPILADWAKGSQGPQLAFWRTLFAGLVLIPFVQQPRFNLRLILAVASFAFMNLTFLIAMTTTTAANAICLQYTAPVWVYLVGVGFWKEKAGPRDRWMIALGLLGVTVILVGEWNAVAGSSWTGAVWGLISGIGFAAVILSMRSLRDLDNIWVVVACLWGSALILLPWVLSQQQWPNRLQAGWLMLFGALQLGLPYALFSRGVRYVSGHEASCLALVEPLLVPVWVFLFWRDTPGYTPPAAWTLVGGGLIIGGLLLRYGRRPERGQPPTAINQA